MSRQRNVRRKAIQTWKKSMKSPFYQNGELHTFQMVNNEWKFTKADK
jgi:hypothetical protein